MTRRSVRPLKFLVFLLCVLAIPASAQKFYTYIQDLGSDYAEIAWGTVDGMNTIGRSAPSRGDATVLIAGRTLLTKANSIVVGDLQPDHEYTYQVSIHGSVIGQGDVRTWAAKSEKLVFFVIGDYGTGQGPQYKIAGAMWEEFQRRAKTDNPVRFMLSLGDNIYGDVRNRFLGAGHTGDSDADWEPKFFKPYEPILARIPFFPTLGNHDGNETEHHGDLPAILDNFAFPQDKPGRYYKFTYSGIAEFFGLDSTRNTESGSARPAYLENSPQFRWMQSEFAKPHPQWMIPYYHHPVFTAGPDHPPSYNQLQHWVRLFASSGVKVVFNGHEHNLQVSDISPATSGICFVVSGAGGELRVGSVLSKMKQAHISAWAQENHFLEVEIDGKTMKITPMSSEPLHVLDSDGHPFPLPIVIQQ